MKKRNAWILLAVLLSVFIFPVPASSATYATVQGGWLRLRAAPSYQAEIITSYPTGSVVSVLDQANGWCHVQTADYRIGYMVRKYLSFPQNPPAPSAGRIWTPVNQTAKIISANGRDVRLRSAPEVTDTNVLGLYPVGRTVTVYKSSNDGWSYIKIDRKHGYMMSRFLTTGSIDELHPPIPVPPPGPSGILSSASLNITFPSAGDTLILTVAPSAATYSAVWYRDDNQLLSTNHFYTVRAADIGHVIHVRISGTGASSGVVLNLSTGTVAPSVPTWEDEVVSWME